MQAIKDYDTNKWKVIGQKVGKPAKVSSLFSLLFVRDFVHFSASCNTSGCLYCNRKLRARAFFALCASQPKTFGTRRRGRLSSYTPSCLHALVFPDDYSELAISYSRQVKPAVHNHPAIPLAVNMLFCLPYSAPRQDRGKCQAKRSRH